MRSGSPRRSRAFHRHTIPATALAAAALAGFPGCQEIAVPIPEPLPANIQIASTPAPGATVRVEDAAHIRIDFSRSMDRESLRAVRRVSFLLPVSVETLEGQWSNGDKRLDFDLTRFPVQRGATYQVVFMGLRAADGELYNMGPYKVLYRTAGDPELLPLQPAARIATRVFCHRIGASDDPCTIASTQIASSAGTDSLVLERRCDDCSDPIRRDWFRRDGNRIVWLGFDLESTISTVVRQVRWPNPPAFLALPSRTGQALVAPTQIAPADGTGLLGWKSTDTGKDSPVYSLASLGTPIQVVFDDCRVIALEYRLTDATGAENHRERWWLYPGVGLVRRETFIERDGTERFELETYTPTLSDFD